MPFRRSRRAESGAGSPSARTPGGRRGTGGRAGESVGRHGADRSAEAADRQAGASGLRTTIGTLGAADRAIVAGVRGAGGQRDRRRTCGGDGGRQDDQRRAFTRRPSERNTFPDHLPRERVVIDPPTACECCGGSRLRKLGEDVTRTLETSRASGRSSRPCGRSSPAGTARRSARRRRRSIGSQRAWAGPSLLAMIVFEKFGQHQPLNRQAERYALEGVPIALSTMADAVGAVCIGARPAARPS